MPLTLREVLELDVVRRGSPQVVAGAGRLDVPVRWVHALELTDVGRLLRGGELVLSTGIALPESAAGLDGYVASLARVGVAGLAVELGRRYADALPPALVAAAQARSVPLVELRTEVAFIEITEAVHTRIIDELLLSRAAATLALGTLLSAQAESLERQAHRTLISALIEGSGFAGLSGAAGSSGFTGQAGAGAADHGAANHDAADHGGTDHGEAAARARALGVEVAGRDLVAVVARLVPGPGGTAPADGLAGQLGSGPATAQAAVLGAAEAIAGACRGAGLPALAGALDDVRAGALLSLPPGGDDDARLRALAARLAAAFPAGLVIGASRTVGSLGAVRDAFREAREVADLAAAGNAARRPYYRLPDLRLRGLLHLLREDARLRSFTDRELGPLLAYDAERGTTLVADLAAFLEAGGNKALAASRAHLARPTFYARLSLIERVLGVSLADPESRACLHVALIAHRESR